MSGKVGRYGRKDGQRRRTGPGWTLTTLFAPPHRRALSGIACSQVIAEPGPPAGERSPGRKRTVTNAGPATPPPTPPYGPCHHHDAARGGAYAYQEEGEDDQGEISIRPVSRWTSQAAQVSAASKPRSKGGGFGTIAQHGSAPTRRRVGLSRAGIPDQSRPVQKWRWRFQGTRDDAHHGDPEAGHESAHRHQPLHEGGGHVQGQTSAERSARASAPRAQRHGLMSFGWPAAASS